MNIIYVDDSPRHTFYERQLPNGVYRYDGYHYSIGYCIDSPTRKTEEEIQDLLSRLSVEFLVSREGYIITLLPKAPEPNESAQADKDITS